MLGAHAYPGSVRDTHGLPAKLQKGGDNLVDTILEGCHGQSRLTITNELCRFIDVENHEAVKIGELEPHSEAIDVVRPKFNKEIFPNAVVWGWTGWRFREGEAGLCRSLMNTTDVGASWKPPLVD